MEERVPAGIAVSIGAAIVTGAAFAASAIPESAPALRYAVLAATVFAFAAVSGRWGVSACVAAIGGLVFQGFLVNQLGELSWSGPADAARMTALIAAVVFGHLAGDIVRLYGIYAAPHPVERPRMRSSRTEPRRARPTATGPHS